MDITNLTDTIMEISPILGRRYGRLTGLAVVLAATGIERHLLACKRYGVEPDADAIREIIDDAQNERAVYAERTP